MSKSCEHSFFADSCKICKQNSRELELLAVIEQMREALQLTQYGFNHRRCPICAGLPPYYGFRSTSAHTKDCLVAKALDLIPDLSALKEHDPGRPVKPHRSGGGHWVGERRKL